MSGRPVLIVLLVACCVAVVLWSRGSSNEETPPESATPAAPDRAAVGSTPIGRERPALVPSESAPVAPAGPFTAEPVDQAFSAQYTALVQTTVEQAIADARAKGVRLDRLECRSQRCQLTLEGPGLMEVLARLEDERGFEGKARELALHDLVNGDDGQPRQVSMTLTFGSADR
ncbi:MAG TPA: hypothetical protein VML75_17810 [Kofleriaceae bacterium]|nr:hypothetical protein [Kofleriaceae bacterium]